MTAQYLFRRVHPLHSGETILYYAAAGGVGLIACQWARARRHDDRHRQHRRKGADRTSERVRPCDRHLARAHRDPGARDNRREGGSGGYDSVGKDTLQASLDSLQPRGVLVSNDTSSGPVVIDAMQLAVKGSPWLTRPAVVHYATPRSHMLQMAEEMFDLMLVGKISSESRSRPFPLEEATEAHRLLEGRKTTGASVLVP
jgi:NADPH2:quinone reductase